MLLTNLYRTYLQPFIHLLRPSTTRLHYPSLSNGSLNTWRLQLTFNTYQEPQDQPVLTVVFPWQWRYWEYILLHPPSSAVQAEARMSSYYSWFCLCTCHRCLCCSMMVCAWLLVQLVLCWNSMLWLVNPLLRWLLFWRSHFYLVQWGEEKSSLKHLC